MGNHSPAPMPFMPQLDGLRAIAVGAVLVHHLLAQDLLPGLLSQVSWGFAGVRLFFVLSGFLITAILLRARADAERLGTSPMWVIRQFYARRFLRIFPLYYFVIFAGALLNLPPIREEFWWLVSYLFNFRLAQLGWYPEHIAHFWSLAVEEQFYLFWPWLVLFAPRRLLLPIALIMSAFGPVSRALALSAELPGLAIYTLTSSCLDTLGLGAALAIAAGGAPAAQALVAKLARLALPVGLFGIITLDALVEPGGWRHADVAHVILYDTAMALFCCWLVAAASQGFSGIFGRMLRFGPVAYCGHIAYGIYVFHLPVAGALYQTGRWLGLGFTWGSYGFFVSASLLTIAVAALSWHAMESPLNDLKRYFPYQRADGRGLKPKSNKQRRST